MRALSIILLTLSLSHFYSQTCQIRLIDSLCGSLDENSGLILVDGDFVTHNDSGGEPKLYTIDTLNGGIDRTVVVANVVNTDWESLTRDDNYIYIGDFGNNSGTRTNLQIHKINITDFITLDTVVPTTTYFNYANQLDFTATPNNTRFDCEAFVAMGDSLVLFSKNWVVNNTYIYILPKVAGTYSVNPIDSLQTSFKVTDATYNKNTKKLALVGYNLSPSTMRLENITDPIDIFTATSFTCGLAVSTSLQVEGITYVNDRLYVSSERFTFGSTVLQPAISEVTDLEIAASVEELESEVVLLQDANTFSVKSVGRSINIISVFNAQGKLVKYQKVNTSNNTVFDTSEWNNGLYLIVMELDSGKLKTLKIVI